MRNPIVNQIQYKKPMKNPSYMKLILTGIDDQTIEQVIACDAILAASLSKKDAYGWSVPLGAVLGGSVGHSVCR